MTGEIIEPLPLFPELAPPPCSLSPDASVVVSLSGGKDSVAALLVALGTIDSRQVIAHHQIILEDWPGTQEYCQAVCDRLRVPLYMTQAVYTGYECCQCGQCYLTSASEPVCRVCSCHEARFLMQVASVLDLVRWRKMWPSLEVRFCTSYFKRDNFNRWARANRALLGPHPVIALGERARESRGRAKLPVLRERAGLPWMLEWRPVLTWRRIDVFRKLQSCGIEPHYCYKAQGMSEEDMYESNVEGGPRMSCVMCFLKAPSELHKSYQVAEARPIIERGIALEREIGHTLTCERSLAQMVTGTRTCHDVGDGIQKKSWLTATSCGVSP
jgi:3'-phosphoadenosine 5'-phosphosulfate sulfotransferase (PAPS reductase)/FAD synthetase